MLVYCVEPLCIAGSFKLLGKHTTSPLQRGILLLYRKDSPPLLHYLRYRSPERYQRRLHSPPTDIVFAQILLQNALLSQADNLRPRVVGEMALALFHYIVNLFQHVTVSATGL